MLFTHPTFLFGFLPICLLTYYLSPKSSKNMFLLLMSFVFYAWGEVFYIAIMLVSILANYWMGLFVGQSLERQDNKKRARSFMIAGLAINLALLGSFKYINFVITTLNPILDGLHIAPIALDTMHLPLGISFFTFQAISYLVDVYRQEVPAQKSLKNLALYISLFPQLIAGPIVRYHDISQQLISRSHSIELFSSGVRRFIYGLAKKMLIANTMAGVADSIFSIPIHDLTLPLAWLGAIVYAMQIYFDFSGYSDMAIGLGRMFGFSFLENFNYPYISCSLREFWQRWHISLSRWFKDYVYIPLGGNRVSTLKVYRNLFSVFLLTGFWHGASWSFIVWGLFHGVFLASEHAGFSKILKTLWKPLQHIYVLLIVVFSWVIFRSDTLSAAGHYLYTMINIFNVKTTLFQLRQNINHTELYAFIIALFLSTPIYKHFHQLTIKLSGQSEFRIAFIIDLPRIVIISSLMFLSIVKIASSTYNPFIYFRF